MQVPRKWQTGENRTFTHRLMTPDRHSPRPGSSAYYAIRFAPKQHRAALQALYEVMHAIHAVPREIEDPGVAATKLNWWRNELREAAQGTAHHPAVLRLQTELQQIDHPCWSALQQGVAAVESDAQQSRYLDEPALLRQVRQIVSYQCHALTSILAPGHTLASEQTNASGVAVALVQLIRRLGHDVRRGVLCVPINELQQFDVKAHEILQIKAGLEREARFQELMRLQAKRARLHLEQARSTLKMLPSAKRRFDAVLLAHNEQLLNALEEANFAVLSQHIGLTPLRKLWLAWTAR
jgi:phytoene synthase